MIIFFKYVCSSAPCGTWQVTRVGDSSVSHRPEERHERRLSPTAVQAQLGLKMRPEAFFTITNTITVHTFTHTHTHKHLPINTYIYIKELFNYYIQIC